MHDRRRRGRDQARSRSSASARSYPIHKFDNAFGGTRFDGGAVGAVINEGQFGLSSHYWEVEQCAGPKSDNTVEPATPLPLPRQADEVAGG